MTHSDIQKRNLTVKEACTWGGFARSTFYKMIKDGDAPAGFKLGKKRLFPLTDLEDWMASLQSKEVH